jgi:hypothetical protein
MRGNYRALHRDVHKSLTLLSVTNYKAVSSHQGATEAQQTEVISEVYRRLLHNY